MKKNSSRSRRGVPDSGHQVVQQPEKVGWIRKFCGRGIFRELWRNRYVVLRGDHLYISDKEVKDERRAQEVFDLADYERSEELRKAKSRSKKNHSRFTVLRCRHPGLSVPNLVFLAVSPEEKESWIHALNVAIIKAKNRILDEVTIEEDSTLTHPTRGRAKIPHGRRLPTRGHLLAVASTSSHGVLTLDLVTEEDAVSSGYDGDSWKSWETRLQVDLQGGACGQVGVGGRQRAGTDVSNLRTTAKESRMKTISLPRVSEWSWGKQSHLESSKLQQVQTQQSQTPQPGKKVSTQGRSRCASMDQVLSSRPVMLHSEGGRRGGPAVQPVGQLQSLIAQKMQRAQELLEEMRLQELQKAKAERERGANSPYLKSFDSPRLHHLRGSDSPNTMRSSGSLSPRLRGRESPRSKAKKSRCKGAESPRYRGSHSSTAKANDSPRRERSPRLTAADTTCSPKHTGPSSTSVSPQHESPPRVRESKSSQVEGSSHSPQDIQPDSSIMENIKESLCQSQEAKTPEQHYWSPALTVSSASVVTEEPAVESRRAEAERLLQAAVSSWNEAQEVLQEVKELQSQTLRQPRRTYEKVTQPVGVSCLSTAAEGDDTPSATSGEGEESETP